MKKPNSPKGAPASKADRRSESESIIAEFLAKGGEIKRMPDVAATAFACATCGHTGIAGFAPGKARKCPKCRSPLDS